ncbi:MAG TPA: hypothetical protein VJM57_04035, partial [Thermodesulfobacteriota bacterium]|nr:hypothetical protein [Thermodesulfobacteriota bacterium]
PGGREGRVAWYYTLCLLFFILGILTKPLIVTFPLILLCYEVYMIRSGKRLAPLAPFFAIALIGAVAAVWAHMGSKSIEAGTLSTGVLFGEVYPTMLPVYWKYVWMVVWPFGLSGLYDTARYGSFLQPQVLASLVAWAVGFVLVFIKGSSRVRFWFLWFWLWFLPVSNLIPIPVYYADRYMYLPAVAFFVLVGELTGKLAGKGGEGMAWRRVLGCAAVAAVVAFYGALASNRLEVWRDDLVFWRDTARKSPGLYKARLNLGYAYEVKGFYAEAEGEYLAAIAIDPTPEAVSNLNMVRVKKKLHGDR